MGLVGLRLGRCFVVVKGGFPVLAVVLPVVRVGGVVPLVAAVARGVLVGFGVEGLGLLRVVAVVVIMVVIGVVGVVIVRRVMAWGSG